MAGVLGIRLKPEVLPFSNWRATCRHSAVTGPGHAAVLKRRSGRPRE
jgi:hypothetical protein